MSTSLVIAGVLVAAIVAAVVARERLHRSHWYFRIEKFIRRYPITVALLLLLAAVGWGQHQDSLGREALHRADVSACRAQVAERVVVRQILVAFQKVGSKSPTYNSDTGPFVLGIAALSAHPCPSLRDEVAGPPPLAPPK